ncbi:MAG: hypothetical protein H0T43_11620 [Solirubrobacterales bacterium]|nr:hypothetical protein [Solirubrobacterales bacterium]
MNAPILKLFGLFLVLFAGLVAFTSWNSVINAESYRENALNQRGLIEEQRIRRGLIRARGGDLLARSVQGEAGLFTRRYTDAAELFAHAIGYSFIGRGRAGLERERNEALIGERNALTSVFDELRGEQQEGDNIITNLDPGAQRVAQRALNGRKGSIVAIEPETGKVRVMLSVPGYDPGDVRDNATFRRLNSDEDNAPLVNRATQSTYPPGSTFKVVTAAAALDSGRFTPDSTVNGDSGKPISGVPLANFGGKDFGSITLTTALTNSVNTVWGQVAEQLGKETMDQYMERFGFNAEPPMDYPKQQLVPSGIYAEDGELLDVESQAVDIGRVAIGQERLLVTPLQMAMVAAAVANGGELIQPRLTDRIVDRDGRTIEEIEPESMGRVMKRSTAAQLTAMMGRVVEEGTGTAAALSGIDVAGKTGTAEIVAETDVNQPWFIGFAPQGGPEIAIAATIERQQGGQGGVDAAPIAKAVLQELLG